ncbi:hypothetical protein ACFYXL_22525 [Streptomyces tsukubensis]|uniref:hypothetical protein n=1 Tax=Streptomyces tsukubensis TaxID=83656 RepID=UPI003697E9C7
MIHDDVDFRLEGYKAASKNTEESFFNSFVCGEFTTLAECHTEDGRRSYYVLHDSTEAFGIPGEPEIVALHIQRDAENQVYRFQHTTVPLPAMAQSWLIARGCPKEGIRLPPSASTDDSTRVLEERIMGDGDHFALIGNYTDHGPCTFMTLVLLRALDEQEPTPFRVLLERVDTRTWTRTLREGGFRTYQEAATWWKANWSRKAPELPALSAGPSSLREPSAVPAPAAPPTGPAR